MTDPKPDMAACNRKYRIMLFAFLESVRHGVYKTPEEVQERHDQIFFAAYGTLRPKQPLR